MSEPSSDVAKTLQHIAGTIGDPVNWKNAPGGWPDDIESALIDSIFSARAVYKTKSGLGIHARVVEWQRQREGKRSSFSLPALIDEIDHVGLSEWANGFGNHQVSPGRPSTAPGGSSKAAAVRESASMLIKSGISNSADISIDNAQTVKQTLRGVPGVGYTTVNYFLILLGAPGVKPDTMIHRFLRNATGHKSTDSAADQTVTSAAAQLSVPTHKLDHAIWRYESELAKS